MFLFVVEHTFHIFITQKDSCKFFLLLQNLRLSLFIQFLKTFPESEIKLKSLFLQILINIFLFITIGLNNNCTT